MLCENDSDMVPLWFAQLLATDGGALIRAIDMATEVDPNLAEHLTDEAMVEMARLSPSGLDRVQTLLAVLADRSDSLAVAPIGTGLGAANVG